ncbi:MAG: hypothetical protein LBU22_01440 [Dysgonamonadaceae bacterium]|jgi:hypothetical protein|nr:hypothetical protein [Dysgonamonadaceae bacterium]
MIKIQKIVLSLLLFLLSATGATAQSFRIEDWKDLFGKGKPLKLTGGFSANSVLAAGGVEERFALCNRFAVMGRGRQFEMHKILITA